MISGIPEPIVKALAHRPAFIWSNRIGNTLDCGCNDGSLVECGHAMLYPTVKFNHDMPWLYSFDLDAWNLPNCIRGDAHRMPFIDNAFDTVVMGDVLEHMPNPIQALSEAERISSQRLVITLPNEARWHKKLSPFHNSTDLMSKTEQEDQTIRHPSIYSKCKDFVKEEKIRHLPHIHSFDFFTIHELLSKGLSKQYMVDISNLYHPLVQKTSDDPSDMPYWGIVVYLKTNLLNFRYGITNLG